MKLLKTALSELEAKYRVSFMYKTELVKVKVVVDPSKDYSSVEEELDHMLEPNGLKYEKVRNGFYIISTKPKGPRNQKVSGNDKPEPNRGQQTASSRTAAVPVKGKVTSETGEGLPGVTVVVKGTSVGTVTDASGMFAMDVPDANATLVFSFIGFANQQVALNGRSTLNVKLLPDVKALQEVVVIGYGTTTKQAVTGSVSQLKTQDLTQNTSTNVAAALQGRVSGVQITQAGGAPGSGVNIRVRGVSSINSGGDPLLVVDGVPSSLGFNDLNPNDIESIDILKDASAGAIYGSRAANGVILVTTKKGQAGQSTFTVDLQQGVNTPTNLPEIMSGAEYLKATDQAYWNEIASRKGQPAPVKAYGWEGFDRSIAEKTNTDWHKLYTQPAGYKQVNVATSGGTEKTQVYISGMYRDEDSYLKGGSYKRANARMSIDHKAKDWLQVGTSINGKFTFENNARAGFGDIYGASLPIYPVYSPNNPMEFFNAREQNGTKGTNKLYNMAQTWSDDQNIRTFSSAYLQLKPLKGLTLRSEWSLTNSSARSRTYQSRDFLRRGESEIDTAAAGSIQYGRYQSYSWNVDNVITYDRSIRDDHGISLMLGNNVQSSTSDGNGLTQLGFPSDYFTLTNANTEVVRSRLSTSFDQYRFASFFGRVKYDFRNKYFAEVNYRTDGATRFGPKNRWGYFPGGAVSWVLTEESFFKSLAPLDFLKLRVSYGVVGNAEMGSNYPYLSQLVNWTPYGGTPGFLFSNIGNQEVRWEKQKQLNVGTDFRLFNNRISGSLDYFVKDSEDLLVSYKIGNFHGYFNSSINQNIGTLRNEGFDLSLNSTNLEVNGFKWQTNFNISRAVPIVTKLSPTERRIDEGTNRVVEGQPLGMYFLPVWAGVDPTTGHELIYEVQQGEVPNNATYTSELTGNVIDANRLNNSEYNNHRVMLKDKTPYPDFYGGLGNSLSYKGLEFNFLFSYQYGNWIYDQGAREMSYPNTEKVLRADVLKNYWTPEKPTNTPLMWNSIMAGRNSTRFLYDGSFIRLRNVQLAYNLPKSLVNKAGIGNVRLYVLGQNLLTFTNYPGVDPENYSGGAGRARNLAPGIDNIGYPQMKSIIGGINFTL